MDGATKPDYDPAKVLTWFALLLVLFAFVYLAGVVAWQLYKTNEVETGTWGQFCLVIGWVLSKAADVYASRYSTNKQSIDKDSTIAQQARTAAIAQDTILDPGVSVVVDPSKSRTASAVLPDATPIPVEIITDKPVPVTETKAGG